MLKQEIIEKITKYFKLTHFEAERIYDDIFKSIIDGVKIDNVTDITNLGEFIVKYNENSHSEHKKTVEFLPSAVFEEEISGAEGVREDEKLKSSEFRPGIVEPENVQQKEDQKFKEEDVTQAFKEEKKEEKIAQPFKEELKKEEQTFKEELKEERYEPPVHTDENLSVEDEMKRKREEILNKLNPQHEEEYHKLLHVTEGIPLNVPKPIVIKRENYDTPINEFKETKEELEESKEESKEIKEEVNDTEKQIEEPVNQHEEEETSEEFTAKSFSDYFTEVKNEQKNEITSAPYIPPVEDVIPPAAVDLHNEIVNEQIPKPPAEIEKNIPEPLNKNGNGYLEDVENRSSNNSFYIWYKDSEPNAVDTQTMSYEYELLYQATKEAEYKSKLRIYVTTFILFFSLVLILLIFSPVIYKYFFTPQPQNEEVQPPEGTSDENPTGSNNKADVNTLEQNTAPSNPPPVTSNEQNNQQQNTQMLTEQKSSTTESVSKTELKDEKLGVTYIQLENGKFVFQESSWNSEEKANNRVNIVNSYNIDGMKGSVVKVDLGSKGTWYRVRFGEFGSLDEAKLKAQELRKK
ncbi:MAG TPA: SPOR domain-containing protein [Ignavibacteria bacterium]|jgi:nucleoid DNA-binding protein